METQEYTRMYELEDTYWWHRGLHKLTINFLKMYIPSTPNLQLLDIGCGTGGLLKKLRNIWPLAQGIDISSDALRFCRNRHLLNLYRGSVTNLPFKSNTFQGLICLDVISHLTVKNDLKALKEFHRILKPGGILVLNLPAFSFLKGNHDLVVHTRERYTKTTIKTRLSKSNFHIFKLTYRNAILFTFILGKRLVESWSVSRSKTDLKPMPNGINKILTSIMSFENTMLMHINFPFGTSTFCIAQKPEA